MICDKDVDMPRRSTKGSAGYDFHAPYDFILTPGEWTDVDTGVRFDGSEVVKCPIDSYEYVDEVKQWVMLLFPRSGLGTRYGVRFANTVGVIDMDYRDNIRAKMTSDVPVIIRKGERFMQGIIIPYGVFASELEPTERRRGGHGSTGL